MSYKNIVSYLGIFAFFVMVTAGYMTTIDASRIFIVIIRQLSICISFLCAFLLIFTDRSLLKEVLFPLFWFVFLVLWGVSLSNINGGFEIAKTNLLRDCAVIISGFILIKAYQLNHVIPSYSIESFFKYYSILLLLVTFFCGGLILDFPPHFVFEYQSQKNDSNVLYSQGVSLFFAISALSCLALLSNNNKTFVKCCLFLLMVGFIVLSILGGARGESIALILIFIVKIATNMKRVIPIILPFIIIVLSMDLSWLNDILIFQRFSVVSDGDWGSRDIFLNQALNILLNEPKCVLIGCGLGYFQSYYNYSYGMYPHNILIEFILCYGVPLTIFMLVLMFNGTRKYIKETFYSRYEFILLLFVYTSLVGLKSGNLFSSWLVIILSILVISSNFKKKTVLSSSKLN